MRSDDASIEDLPGGRKRIRVTVGYDPVTGQQKRASKTIRGTRKEAREVRDAIKRRFRTADALTYGRLSVYELVREDIARRDLAATTLHGYETTLANHIAPYFADVKVSDVRRVHIRHALDSIKAPGAKLNAYKLLRAAFREAIANEWMVGNPMADVDEPELPRYEADTYTIDEVLSVLDFARGTTIEPGLIIAAWAGTRPSETCALNRQDLVLVREVVDGEVRFSGHVQVRENYVTVPGKRVMKEPKTERSKRDIALPGFAVERLLEILGQDRIGPLMMDAKGERMTPAGFASRWRRLMLPRRNKAGDVIYEPPIRYLELKLFRHSRITNLLEAGEPLELVSADAGHSIERTTEAVYNRRRRKANRSTAAVFERAVADRSSGAARPNSS